MPSAGFRLGPYEILSTIGAGGMGEVYRAQDSRIGREVAIKILPSQFSENAERLRRFEQEVRAAGALNHPNILSLYDVGTENGTPYLVTELLHGETLRRKILDGPLGLRKAIEYALQIAHGLSSAHEKGITHRDLKPENLFITKEGRVKILDFGLAKLTHQEFLGTQVETITHQTQPGEVLGTVVYMSPEQVRGTKADHRSDIFAFGSILYEMLSGKRPFQGDSSVEVMHAILKSDPPNLLQSNLSIPPAMEKIARRCLEKDPEQRFQSTSDLAFALEALSSSSAATEQTPAKLSGAKYARVLLAGFILLTIGVLIYGATRIKRTPVAPQTISTSSFLPYSWNRVTFRRGFVSSAAFAPDGQTILYTGEWVKPLSGEMYFARLGNSEARTLGLKDMEILSVSSTGQLALLLKSYTLAEMPFAGGVPRELAKNIQDADWSPDGKGLAIIRSDATIVEPLMSVEFPIGKKLYSSNHHLSKVRFSPRGNLIAFLEMRAGRGRSGIGRVNVLDLNGKVRTLYETEITSGRSGSMGLAFSALGDEIWFSARPKKGTGHALCAVDLSGRFREIMSMNSQFWLFDIASDGKILLARSETKAGMAYYSEIEGKERDVSWLSGSIIVDISNDGRYLLFIENVVSAADSDYGIYLRDVQASDAIRLGDGLAWDLSPDGNWVLAFQKGSVILLPTGAGEIKTLSKGWQDGRGAFFPDGKRILMRGSKSDGKPQIYVQSINGGELQPAAPPGVYTDIFPENTVSPDGKRFFGCDDVNGWRIHSLEGGEPIAIKGLEGDETPQMWAADGSAFYVESGLPSGLYGCGLFKIDVKTGRREFWKQVTVLDSLGIHYLRPVFTQNGKHRAYSYMRTLSDLYVLEGLK